MYELYLCHHGVKGQHWGVRHGPPYPLRRVTTKSSAKEQNEIYNTMTEDDKRKLQGIDKDSKENAPRKFTDEEQLASEDHVKTFMAKYGNIPVSAFGVWNEGDGNIAVSIMTRSEPEYRGKGYATAVVKRGMNWINNNSRIKNAYWDVRKDNAASIALAKKMGFEWDPRDDKYPEWTTYRKSYNR